MSSIGEFHREKNDGKLFLVYHQPEYFYPIQKKEKNLFRCPSSPEDDHHVLPLYWCNNKEFDVDGGCSACIGAHYGTDYYFCESHLEIYHKECVEAPPQIRHPYHSEHSLQLYSINSSDSDNICECLCCGRICFGTKTYRLGYSCINCKVHMHPICAMKTISFVIDPPKRHDHPLTFFPRQTSLTCNICGLLRKQYPTYICAECNFVAHIDCMRSPNIIKMARHNHRISYIPSLPIGEWSCGICRQNIDYNYGAYTCDKCSDYVVHPRCALWKYVWDGEELDGVQKEGDIENDVKPFHTISEGLIFHFLHDHQLLLNVNILYDEKKFCQACAIPIFEGNFYSCIKCDYFFHEACANAPRIIQHALHPHPLTLRATCRYDVGCFLCSACNRDRGGFVYDCRVGECTFDIDVRCALLSEPFDYEGHEHPLFLVKNPIDKPICHVCKTECHRQLNCIECSFIVCIKCATLPSKVRYKHDKHFLTVLYGEEVWENYWCEVCERDLGDSNAKVIYGCRECCTTFHMECLFGKDPYFKPGQFYSVGKKEIQIVLKSNLSRPLCDYCKNRCQDIIFKIDNRITCSAECAFQIRWRI